jgi:sugar phosphate isomerase/epimerase
LRFARDALESAREGGRRMLRGGLVSITFRDLSPAEVVGLVAGAGLQAVEWGGDVHCPHGDAARAEEVRRLTEDAGLAVSAYGSYYRLAEENEFSFEDVLASARALGAPTVRVWAGRRGSADADAEYRAGVVDESRRLADAAAAAGLTVSYEYHANTLTDTNDSAIGLLEEVDHPAVRSFWQPPNGRETDYRLAGLKRVKPWMTNVHIFTWDDQNKRLPLAEGRDWWKLFLAEAATTGRDHDVLMEFVEENAPENFKRDAEVLKTWLAAADSQA